VSPFATVTPPPRISTTELRIYLSVHPCLSFAVLASRAFLVASPPHLSSFFFLLFFVPVPYRSVYLVAFLVLLACRVVRTSSSVCLFYLVFVCFVILYYYYLLLLPEFRFVLCVFDFFFCCLNDYLSVFVNLIGSPPPRPLPLRVVASGWLLWSMRGCEVSPQALPLSYLFFCLL